MQKLLRSSFLLMLALLAMGEIAMRIFLPPAFTGSFEYGFNQTAGFEERPDGTVHLAATRARNFHPQTFLRQKPSGMFRIFVIGDSVEYFDDMLHNEPPLLTNTYAALLGAELRKKGVNAESFNLGVAGNGSVRSQIILRQALNYQPSLIVLKICDRNDAWEETNFQRAEEFKSWHPKNWLRRSYLVQALIILKESYFLNQLPRKIQDANRIGDDDPFAVDKRPMPDVRQLPRFCQTIRESIALARAHNVPILLVAQSMTQSDAAGHLTPADHGLSAFAEELCGPGVSYFSMKQLFAGLPLEPLYVDHMHLKRAGHQLVARALAEQIIAQQIKPANPVPPGS